MIARQADSVDASLLAQNCRTAMENSSSECRVQKESAQTASGDITYNYVALATASINARQLVIGSRFHAALLHAMFSYSSSRNSATIRSGMKCVHSPVVVNVRKFSSWIKLAGKNYRKRKTYKRGIYKYLCNETLIKYVRRICNRC